MNALLVAICALGGLQEEPSSHRHVSTEAFPVPDWIADPELRRLLWNELRTGSISKLLGAGGDRQRFLDWYRKYAESGRELDPGRMAQALLSEDPDLVNRFLFRLQDPDGSLRLRVERLMKRFQGNLGDAGRDPGRWLDPDRVGRIFRPAMTRAGARMMNRVLAQRDWQKLLSGELDSSLARLESWMASYADDSSPFRPRGPAPAPRAGRAEADPRDPVERAGARTMAGTLIEGPEDGRSETFTWIFLSLAAAAFVIWSLWRWRAERRGDSEGRTGRKSWSAPTLPDSLRRPEELVDVYRRLHRYALQRELTGLSHREIAAASGGAPAGELAEIFEAAYYDGAPSGEALSRALPLCRQVLEESRR